MRSDTEGWMLHRGLFHYYEKREDVAGRDYWLSLCGDGLWTVGLAIDDDRSCFNEHDPETCQICLKKLEEVKT